MSIVFDERRTSDVDKGKTGGVRELFPHMEYLTGKIFLDKHKTPPLFFSQTKRPNFSRVVVL